MAKKKAAVPKLDPAAAFRNLSAQGILDALKKWAITNRIYIIAFFIPIVIMYISYAIFGLYPFGEESVLVLDLNAQYVYYFEALRDAFWGDGSAFYSWSRNLSGEYMGIIGYYLASPFTLIVMLLPEKWMLTSLLIMILAKVGSASVTFCYYLQKSKNLEPKSAMIFGVMYSLCAYMVIQTLDPMWLDGLVFLPLIILGVEYLIDDGRKLNYIIPIAIMFVANFYIGYMIGIFTAFYFLYYLFLGSETKRKKLGDYVYVCCNFAVTTLVSIMLSAFMLIPVVNALQLGKFGFSGKPDYSFKTQFEPLDVIGQLLIAQYDTVNVDGSPEIYCGILCVVLLPLFFLNSNINIRKKLGHGLLLAVMFFSMYIKPVDMMWHGGQVPNWLPFRYSFIISFILLSMAASAFKNIDGTKLSHIGGVFFGVLVLLLYIGKQDYDHLDMMKTIWLSIGLAAIYLTILYLHAAKPGKFAIPIMLVCILSGELIFNNVHTFKAIDKDVAYSTRASYEMFVQSGRGAVDVMEDIDDGLYRSEKTYARCVNDNLAFGLKGISHSSSVMNAKTLSFIETLGYCTRSYYSRYDGTTELADSLLGIKYVLDRGDKPDRPLLHPSYEKVTEYKYKDKDDTYNDGDPREKTISIYENPNALSIGYMADADILNIDHLGNDNPFNSQNILLSTLTGNTEFDEANQITGFHEYYTRIDHGEPVLGAVTLSDYNGQACYTKMPTGDPTIDYRFTVTEEKEIFMFLKTENEQSVNLWFGTKNADTGEYDFKSFGTYFNGKNYCILDMGKHPVGTELCMRVTVDNEHNATIIKDAFFYYFNRDVYQADVDTLKDAQLEITKHKDTYIKGTVTASEDEVLFTSIPYQPGWTVKVDGRRVDHIESLQAMIAVKLSPGTHTVTFSYTPPGFVFGVVLLIIGIGMLVLFYRHDKKYNKVLLARKREKKLAAIQAEKKA
ncbi:MAG: YfhO family protein [Oscillospiraceae bacterium]|nr:YfhO family protein [Oscillospiraceae bacterium]MBR6616542.1 YfhO family protein [Oscillospiraceae bacterium]